MFRIRESSANEVVVEFLEHRYDVWESMVILGVRLPAEMLEQLFKDSEISQEICAVHEIVGDPEACELKALEELHVWYTQAYNEACRQALSRLEKVYQECVEKGQREYSHEIQKLCRYLLAQVNVDNDYLLLEQRIKDLRDKFGVLKPVANLRRDALGVSLAAIKAIGESVRLGPAGLAPKDQANQKTEAFGDL